MRIPFGVAAIRPREAAMMFFLARLFRRCAAAQPQAARLFLEALEDRLAPAANFSAVNVSGTPISITNGPDGAVWFIEGGLPGTADNSGVPFVRTVTGTFAVGRLDTNQILREITLPDTGSNSMDFGTSNSLSSTDAVDITAGPDGALWFTEVTQTSSFFFGSVFSTKGRIERLSTSNDAITTFDVPGANSTSSNSLNSPNSNA